MSAELAPVGVQNTYYQVHGYFGSRVLEHNETDRFTDYVEVVWTQQASVDKRGRVWMVDRTFHQVVMMEPATRYVPWPALFMHYAGLRGKPGSSDGGRLQARFNTPMGLAISEPEGRSLVIYVSDTNNHVIRRITFDTGRVKTIAGLAGSRGLCDGVSNRARFDSPMTIGVDADGEHLFVLDNGRRLRHVNMRAEQAVVSTLIDGACRAVSRFSGHGSVVHRRVGCHPDWLAKDAGDNTIGKFEFEAICAGHRATCGPRGHPALHDRGSPFLRLDKSKPRDQ